MAGLRKKTVINENGKKGASFMTEKDADLKNEVPEWTEADQIILENPSHPEYKAVAKKAQLLGIEAPKQEGGSWATQTGPSDAMPAAPENISELDTKGTAKGNQGDNKVENAGEMDTRAVENAQKNMRDAMTPEEKEKYYNEGTGTVEGKPEDYLDEDEKKRLEAEKLAAGKGDIKTEDVGDSGSAKKDAEEIVKEVAPKGDKNNRHYKATKSIWSAYYDGDFGEPGSKEAKEVAWYYTIDSLAKLGNKIGKNIRNVGAAWSGGTIDTSEDEKSAWTEHQESLRKEASDITKEGMGGSAGRQAMSENLRNEAMSLANDRNTTVKDLIDFYAKKMGKADSPITEQTYANIIANLAGAGSNMSLGDKIVTMGGDGIIDKVYNAVAGFFGF